MAEDAQLCSHDAGLLCTRTNMATTDHVAQLSTHTPVSSPVNKTAWRTN